YRLGKRYLGDRCVHMPITDPRLAERIQRERQRLHADDRRTGWLPIHEALSMEQQRLTIGPDSDATLDALPEHTRLCQDVLVSNIRRREFHFSVGSTARVFNSITGLKRE